jgi:O-antigen/teichoic acid export membrane protein
LLIVLFVYILSYVSLTWMLVAEILSALIFLLSGYFFLPVRDFNLRTRDKETERALVRFARWIGLSQLFAMLATRIDLALIGAFSDAMGLGLYSAAQKVIGLMTVAVVSYSSVLFIEMSAAPSPASLSVKRKEAFAIVIAVVIGIGIAALLADPLIPLLFGDKFIGAVPVFRIMCLGLAFVVAAFPTNGTLFARNRSFAFPVMSGISIAVLVPANVILVPSYGPVGAAVAYTLGTAAAFLVSVGLTLFLGSTVQEKRADG